MTGAVIYLFVSPSGRAYAGRHLCDHTAFHRRGFGPLPDGYAGSGKLWQNVARKHGPAIRWIILRRFGPDAPRADIDAAERRAIRLARHLWASRCVNLREGGQGFTSADARALWADPDMRLRKLAQVRALNQDPDWQARRAEMNRTRAKTPLGRAQLLSALAKAHAPEARAKTNAAVRSETGRALRSADSKARSATPEGQAQWQAAHAKANTPEARAKAAATRARNKALRAMETQQ